MPDVRAAMDLLAQAVRRFLPEGDTQKLTIAASASIAHCLLAPHMAAYRRRYPDIAVQLVTTIWPDDFAATNADIEIRFGAPGVVGTNAKLLEPSYLHAAAAPHLASQLPDIVTLQDMRALSLIQPVGRSASWASLSRKAKLTEPFEANLYVDTHGMAVDLAIAGAGVALSHCQVTREAIRQGTLQEIPLPHIPAQERYYIALKSTDLPTEQSQFMEWFAQLITVDSKSA